METLTSTQTETSENVVLCDIPRSENDLYRITRKQFRGNCYTDLRIFFKPKGNELLLAPSSHGLCFPDKFRKDIIAGLIKARQTDLPERAEGGEFASVKVCEIPISETERYRISKGSGPKNAFVDVRKFFLKDGAYVPSRRKGVSILGSSLDDVITGLMRTEPEIRA